MEQATQAYYMKHLGIPMWIPRDLAGVEENSAGELIEARAPFSPPQPTIESPSSPQPALNEQPQPNDDADADFIDPSRLQSLVPKPKPEQGETLAKTKAVISSAFSGAVDPNDVLNATWEGLRAAFAQIAVNDYPQAVAARGSLKAKTAVFNAEAVHTEGQQIQAYNALLANMLKAMRCNPAACFYSEALRYPFADEQTTKIQRAIVLRQAALLDMEMLVIIGDYPMAENLASLMSNVKTLRLPSPQAILQGELSKPNAWAQMAPQLLEAQPE